MTTDAPQNRRRPGVAWRPALALTLVLAATAALPRAGFAAPDEPANDPAQRCGVPLEMVAEPHPLPGFARALQTRAASGTPVTIVVIGSLSSGARGEARGVPGFPARLQTRLASRLAERGKAVAVKVEMVGRSRALAGELAGLLRRQVLPMKPDLVIWQAGRADARKGNPPYRFGSSLAEGLDFLRKQGIDTILADIQFHPQFEALYRTDDYRNYVRWIVGERDLPLLRRYEMIEYWAMANLIDLDSADDAEQQTAYAFIQECLAFQAVRMIMGGAGLWFLSSLLAKYAAQGS